MALRSAWVDILTKTTISLTRKGFLKFWMIYYCNINGSTFSFIYCDLLATDQLRKSFSPLQAKGRISATLPKLLPFRGYQQLIPKNLQNKIFLKKRRFLQLLKFGRFLFLKYVRFSLVNILPC